MHGTNGGLRHAREPASIQHSHLITQAAEPGSDRVETAHFDLLVDPREEGVDRATCVWSSFCHM
jgi:hypothetical protein